jgi:hypothetical protein
MNSLASVHAGRVVINSICDEVGFINPPQPHANALPVSAGMNATAGITLFVSVPAPPAPYRYEEWSAAIRRLVFLGCGLRGCSYVIDDYIQHRQLRQPY